MAGCMLAVGNGRVKYAPQHETYSNAVSSGIEALHHRARGGRSLAAGGCFVGIGVAAGTQHVQEEKNA